MGPDVLRLDAGRDGQRQLQDLRRQLARQRLEQDSLRRLRLQRPREHNDYPDAQPYKGTSTNPNRDVLNLDYWQKLDQLVQYMDSKGMVADLIVTNPYREDRQFGTDTQNDRFVNYVRTATPPIRTSRGA